MTQECLHHSSDFSFSFLYQMPLLTNNAALISDCHRATKGIYCNLTVNSRMLRTVRLICILLVMMVMTVLGSNTGPQQQTVCSVSTDEHIQWEDAQFVLNQTACLKIRLLQRKVSTVQQGVTYRI